VLLLDDYCGSYLYENGTSASVHPLTKILTPEGYIDMSTSGYPNCYYKQDHLGSNREVTSYAGTTGTVVQQTEYYPSGTAYVEGTGAGVQPFKFTGKELILMHGLNWQDFGARWLDNVRMQWTTMDPLCEKYYAISPYTYCSDDPAKNIDPDGRSDGLVGSFLTGSLNAAVDQYKGLEQLVTHPIQTIKATLTTLDNISNKISQDGVAGTIIKGEAKIINTVNNNSANQNAYLASYSAVTAVSLFLGGESDIARIGSVAGKLDEAGEAANALGKAGATAAESSTTVFRAVSQGELEDIAAHGLRNRAGVYETGKLFAPTLEEAAQFGKNNFKFDRLPNAIMKVKVPNSVMQNAYRFGADGMNAISIPAECLQFLKATPLNYSPLIP
jgi:RHS repeat-associated protein